MILYFTGTGNSKYVAEAIAEGVGDTIVSLNDVIKNKESNSFRSKKPFVIVAPIYAWRYPRVVEDFIKSAEFTGSKKMYFIATMAGNSGGADKYCKKICKYNDLDFKGFMGICMPNNYIVDKTPMVTEEKVNKILADSKTIIDELVDKIKNRQSINKRKKEHFKWFLSGVINGMFNKFVSSKDFVVSDKCVSCGKCEKLCAMNNIKLVNKKPEFGDKCINCFACINHCPVVAIDVKGKTEGKSRYVCPEYKKKEV